jgi:hypothetical protein
MAAAPAPTPAKAVLSITSLATGRLVWWDHSEMKLTGYSDNVSPNFNEEIVYGRMDPIMTYQGTTRAINLSFKEGPYVPTAHISKSKVMLQRRGMLMRSTMLLAMQYPTYSDTDNALSISRPPLVRVWFANLVRNGRGGGLLCAMPSVSFKAEYGHNSATVPTVDGNDILPNAGTWEFQFNVLHEQTPGWTDDWAGKSEVKGQWMGGEKWGSETFKKKKDSKALPPFVNSKDQISAPTKTGLESMPTAEQQKWGIDQLLKPPPTKEK